MNYKLENVEAKMWHGNIVYLYGDESAGRAMPLSRKEMELIKARREKEKDFVEVFDRLPWRLYFVSFDSEREAADAQERLRCTVPV